MGIQAGIRGRWHRAIHIGSIFALVVVVGSSRTAADSQTQEPNQEPPSGYVFRDRISVELATVVIRVIEGDGTPIRGLTSDDFVVRKRDQDVPVVAVEWISNETRRTEEVRPTISDGPVPFSYSAGRIGERLIVFWIQTDLHGVRIRGLLRIQPVVRRILAALEPEDRVAVVSFDSRLNLRQDFTRDREAPAQAIEDAIFFGKQPMLRRGSYPSLAEHFDFRAARRAAKAETALRLTAEALAPLPGEKLLIFLGWGLGRYGAFGFSMTGEYFEALQALDAARASVFVLDITDADFHTLELGLREVAEDTGGTYEKTNRFTLQAAKKLIRAISGYYVLTLDRSGITGPLDGLDIRLPGLKARILTRAG